MILELLDEAQSSGARLAPACEILGLDPRTIDRWRARGGGEDRRQGPHREPENKLSATERQQVVQTLTSPEYRDLSPHQVVPQLADEGIYLASESTMYRILRQEDLAVHRERSRPASSYKPQEWLATGPSQVWSWDITYLRSPVRGQFFYLYLITDVWSRKIMGAAVHREESSELAAQLFLEVCREQQLDATGIVLHSDNGGPMKGSTMLATLQRLGVIPSFSRPRVSDDNPFSEALFRTLKYRPEFPSRPFASCEEASAWVEAFLTWYNTARRSRTRRLRTGSWICGTLARRWKRYRRRRHAFDESSTSFGYITIPLSFVPVLETVTKLIEKGTEKLAERRFLREHRYLYFTGMIK